MRIISENSEEELARRKADAARQEVREKLRFRLRELASNLLRVVRGAGKPSEIGAQAQALVKAMVDYREVAGYLPPPEEIAAELDFRRDSEFVERLSVIEELREHAEETMSRGALQIAASRLLGQLTQERAGHTELHEGLRRLEVARAEARRQRSAEERVSRSRTRRVRKKAPGWDEA